jgi:hypothetical protein
MVNAVSKDDDDKVTVATLVRGKNYSYHHVTDDGISHGYTQFERNVPLPVSEEIAVLLEDLVEEVPDGDGDLVTKDMFHIERDAPARAVMAPKKKVRFRLISEEVDERPVTKAPLRKPLVAAKRTGGFKARGG